MKFQNLIWGLIITFMKMGTVKAQQVESILITNASIYDGNSDQLNEGQSVLIEGNIIKKIASSIKAPKGAQVIDAKGATLSPDFMDSHAHLSLNTGPADMFYAPAEYHSALALSQAEKTLMMGFKTIRDVGGSVFGVKRAIDEG